MLLPRTLCKFTDFLANSKENLIAVPLQTQLLNLDRYDNFF
jgi:hypothetical protein